MPEGSTFPPPGSSPVSAAAVTRLGCLGGGGNPTTLNWLSPDGVCVCVWLLRSLDLLLPPENIMYFNKMQKQVHHYAYASRYMYT